MDCCASEAIEDHFGREKAVRQLERYRRKGSQGTTRILVDALIAQGVEDRTLLDVGGGIGAIQHELIRSGIRHAVNLEASSAYIDACRQEAERAGHAERITHFHGSLTDREGVPEADIVTLERVICCYPDMTTLVNASCRKARILLGLVFPHRAWWVRLGMACLYNTRFRLAGDPFRVYLHDTNAIEDLVAHNGFQRLFMDQSGPWQVAVYRRRN